MKSLHKPTDHPYYCSDSNYYSNEPHQRFDTVSDFLDEFEDADLDMNLCFRFDINGEDRDDDKAGHLYVEIFLMLQRKGIFKPIHCAKYDPEKEAERLGAYLQKHFNHLKKMWKPFK